MKADLARSEFGLSGEGLVCAVVSTGVDGAHPHFAPFGNTVLPAPLCHLDYTTLQNDLRAESERVDAKATPKSKRLVSVHTYDPEDRNILFRKRYVRTVPVDGGRVGTAVASIIAGRSTDHDGTVLQGFTDQTKILSIRMLNDEGGGSEFDLLAALNAIGLFNQNSDRLLIHVAVLPLSFPWDMENFACGQSPICVAVDRLVNSGVVVAVSAGNRGVDRDRDRTIEGGITDPGNSDLAIVVGSTHRTAPELYGASYFSCRGPTADGRRKPDLLAPGERITVAAAISSTRIAPKAGTVSRGRKTAQATYDALMGHRLDGTELAAAHVAGAALAVLAAQPDLVGKPKEVKGLLLRTAVDLHRDPDYQGNGLLDVLTAVRSARGATDLGPSAASSQRVFVSYSHKDEALWKEFRAHLSPLERTGRIQVWSDQKLKAGERWEKEIDARLNGAQIVLLLVSAHFFESDFCYSKELKRALEREAEGTTRIVPVIVRPVSLKGTPLAQIQALPAGAKPITEFDDPHQGWAQVADRLFDIVEELAGRKS